MAGVEFFVIYLSFTLSSGESQVLDTEHGEVIQSVVLWVKTRAFRSVKCSETNSSITATKKLTFMIINESQRVHVCV